MSMFNILHFLRRSTVFSGLVAVTIVAIVIPGSTQNDLQDNSGPIMQSTTAFPIFWLPTGQHYDPSGAAGDATYEATIRRFFSDLTGTGYLNIVSQYPGVCGPPTLAAMQSCFGAVTLAPAIPDDTHAYPHTGKPGDELQDSDIQSEVMTFITTNGLTPGQNMEFFVFTAQNINICSPTAGCTESDFCAYHSDFSMGGSKVMYAVMPNASSFGGCGEGISSGPNLLSADRETVTTSHEFAESLTDPQVLENVAWADPLAGREVGDNCNTDGNPQLGSIQSDGSNVTFGNDKFVVQEEWSNDDSGCVLSVPFAITGSNIEFTTLTGQDNLRGDSSLVVNLQDPAPTTFQTSTMKAQNQPSWDNDTTHVRVFGTSLPSAGMGGDTFALTSHNSSTENNDQWQLQFVNMKVRNPDGSFFCQQLGNGNPLADVTDGASFTFLTPSCVPPPSPVFDRVEIVIQTGNDDAGSGDEITAWFSGQPVTATLGGQSASICLKPRTNVGGDGVCPNGSGATDQQGQDTWNNWHVSDQTFALASPQTSASGFGTITITLVQNGCGLSCDNWDIQGITVTVFSANGLLPRTTLLNMSNSQNGDNCMARLKTGSNPNNVIWNLSATDPTGVNVSMPNPVFGATPPGLCPQGNFPYM